MKHSQIFFTVFVMTFLALMPATAGADAAKDFAVKMDAAHGKTAGDFIELAKWCRKNSLFEEAKTTLNEALKYEPGNKNALQELSEGMSGAQNADDAVWKEFDKQSWKIRTDYALELEKIIKWCNDKKLFAEAAELIDEALTVFPGNPQMKSDMDKAIAKLGGMPVKALLINLYMGEPSWDKWGWDKRKYVIVNYINKTKPLLLCITGVNKETSGFFKDSLKDYELITPVDVNPAVEINDFALIGYAKGRLEAVKKDFFYLNEDATKPGIGWDGSDTKFYLWAIFKEPRTGQEFYAGTAVFDSLGQKARDESAKLIAGEVQKSDVPGKIIFGTFYADAKSQPYNTITKGCKMKGSDSEQNWVLYNDSFDMPKCDIVDYNEDKIYTTYYKPMLAKLLLKSQKKK